MTQPSVPTLRPLEFGEIIDAAFRLYTGNFRKLIIIAAVILLPLGFVALLAIDSMGLGDFAAIPQSDITGQQIMSFLGGAIVGGFGTIILTLLGTALIQAACIHVYGDSYQGIDNPWLASLKAGLTRVLPVVGATILIGLGSGVGLLFCIAPGVWLWTSWYVSVPALISERKGVFDAMTRSWNLVKPRFWPTLGIGVVTFLIIALIQQAFSFVATTAFTPMLSDTDPNALSEGIDQFLGVSTMISTLGEIITLPFAAAVATVVYFDLRVRHEGYDIEQLSRELSLDRDNITRPTAPPVSDDPFGLDEPNSD